MSGLPEMSSKISPRLVKIFTAVVVLTIALFGSLVWYAWDTFRYIETTQKNYFRLTELSGSIVHLDEVLTMSANMAAATGGQAWEVRYRGSETKLDAAIKEAMVLGQELSLKDEAEKTDTANRKLVDIENQVFDLVRNGKTEKAALILSSAEYNAQKEIYISGIAQITETIRRNLEKNISEYNRRGHLVIGAILIVTPFLLFGWILVARLIRQYNTNRKQVEEALRESEEKYRLLVENANEALYVLQDGVFRYANRICGEMLGVPLAELIGVSMLQFINPDDGEQAISQHVRILSGELAAGRSDFRVLTRHGEERWTDVNSVRIPWDGKPATLNFAMDITDRKRAEEQLQKTLESLRKAVGTTIQVISSTVEARDPYTSGHQTRSADLARAIAVEMGLPQDKIDAIRMAGSIHDIGKISIPAEILSKPTKLSDIEFSLIKEHARKGYEMLKDVESPWPLAEIVHQHHERMDGSGYPRNLKGEEICMEARILSVADVVEAMASHRPYRAGLGIETALAEIEKNKGIFYDAAVADVCLSLFREKHFQLAEA